MRAAWSYRSQLQIALSLRSTSTTSRTGRVTSDGPQLLRMFFVRPARACPRLHCTPLRTQHDTTRVRSRVSSARGLICFSTRPPLVQHSAVRALRGCFEPQSPTRVELNLWRRHFGERVARASCAPSLDYVLQRTTAHVSSAHPLSFYGPL
ncbi:hypothetical protein EXIGLDRAFT_462513 [Exidia glandulosa HHB12029]|uniref:Uncharacterized protein n=1 Tax=Exidia glandulosa HHB12029 TaxID=1314781 RepID=A0A165K3H4_EXIGL|nr:hypothetical protein EXIGLDRAFT_462513 [Exidia glandulosa HHB12029]